MIMKYGLGKILETQKLPQVESLGVTEATRFIEVYQVLVTNASIVVVNKQGKILRRVEVSRPLEKVTATREVVRGLVNSFRDSHSLKAIIGNADKGLLIEVVTAEEDDFSPVSKETAVVDFMVTKITNEEVSALTEATRHDEPLLEPNSIAYWRKEKYGALLGKQGPAGIMILAAISALLFMAPSVSLALITFAILIPAVVLSYEWMDLHKVHNTKR